MVQPESDARPLQPTNARLLFRLLAAEDLPVLHALARDEHIRRFLLDACRRTAERAQAARWRTRGASKGS